MILKRRKLLVKGLCRKRLVLFLGGPSSAHLAKANSKDITPDLKGKKDAEVGEDENLSFEELFLEADEDSEDFGSKEDMMQENEVEGSHEEEIFREENEDDTKMGDMGVEDIGYLKDNNN